MVQISSGVIFFTVLTADLGITKHWQSPYFKELEKERQNGELAPHTTDTGLGTSPPSRAGSPALRRCPAQGGCAMWGGLGRAGEAHSGPAAHFRGSRKWGEGTTQGPPRHSTSWIEESLHLASAAFRALPRRPCACPSALRTKPTATKVGEVPASPRVREHRVAVTWIYDWRLQTFWAEWYEMIPF